MEHGPWADDSSIRYGDFGLLGWIQLRSVSLCLVAEVVSAWAYQLKDNLSESYLRLTMRMYLRDIYIYIYIHTCVHAQWIMHINNWIKKVNHWINVYIYIHIPIYIYNVVQSLEHSCLTANQESLNNEVLTIDAWNPSVLGEFQKPRGPSRTWLLHLCFHLIFLRISTLFLSVNILDYLGTVCFQAFVSCFRLPQVVGLPKV